MNGLVSTIIPVYNRAVFLEDAVQSVLGQSYGNIEIVLVDDGSTDGTSEVVEALVEREPSKIKSVRIANQGPGGAREAGRQMAEGDYIQYLDSDDLLLQDKFELQTAALMRNPDCGIAYGITRLIDESGKVLREPYKWTAREYDYLFPALLVDRWWNTHTPLWRRSVCDAVGPWPNARMSEDWRYEARAAALRVKLAFVNEVVAETRAHGHDRLTAGGATREKLSDIASLISDLHEAARAADIELDSAEMKHFSRCAFLVARQAGAAGLSVQAQACFDLAWQSTATPDRKMKVVGKTARIVGWKLAGTLCGWRDKLSGDRVGPDSLRQSWVDPATDD